MRSARIAAAILALAMALTLWLTGQGRGLLHAVIYMLGVLPGIPIGIRLFGKRHPAAWIAGALLGYGLLQLAIWATIESRLSSGWAFVAVWIVLGALTTVLTRGSGSTPAIAMPSGHLAIRQRCVWYCCWSPCS